MAVRLSTHEHGNRMPPDKADGPEGVLQGRRPPMLSVRLRGQFELQFNVMQSLSDQLLTCAERCQVDL
jgi:hypothetical protein